MTPQIDLVIEELAPSAKVVPTLLRMLQYLKGGVPLVWLVDNHDRCVTVYRKGDECHLFEEGEEITPPYAIPGSPVRVSELLTPLGNEVSCLEKLGTSRRHLNDKGKRE